MNLRRKFDGQQAIDYCKVEAVIYSCKTFGQMEVAQNMCTAFDKMYNDPIDFNQLDSVWVWKMTDIRENNATSKETE